MKTIIKSYIGFVVLVFMISCVPTHQFKDLQGRNIECEEERDRLFGENEALTVENTELKTNAEAVDGKIEDYEQERVAMDKEMEKLQNDYTDLETKYFELQKTQENLIKGNVEETKRLLRQLETTQNDLKEREDKLREMQNAMNAKQQNLDALQVELEMRNKRLIELERILARKDSAVNALKNKVTTALLGFEKEGLSVSVQNGKVYVSLDEKLLFPSGSAEVDPKGERALKKLAKVLEQNTDINIMIEGHTDDVPYIESAAIKDNWDLSVKRATSIVRILLEGTSIDPKRLMAAGRGEFLPVDPRKTAEARQKNRRTEIILTPKLDELLEILESN